MEETKRDIVLDVEDVPKAGQWITLSIQHLFAMFGATVLVPFLVGLSPAVALVSSGLGTLSYLLITKGQIPAYLGSSLPSLRQSSRKGFRRTGSGHDRLFCSRAHLWDSSFDYPKSRIALANEFASSGCGWPSYHCNRVKPRWNGRGHGDV